MIKWELFRSEAQELWKIYREATKPIRIKRIALRYINKIDIPLPANDFKDYILTTPEIAPSLPQGLSHFFMQLTIPNPDDEEMVALINQTMQPSTPEKLPYIFDIDVWKMVSFENADEMWNEFEKLREYKNHIFLKSITKKTKELFR